MPTVSQHSTSTVAHVPTPAPPHWTAQVSAFALPLIAVIGAIIAYRQWRTAQNKLKLELFERRMEVYGAARELLGHITRTGKISLDEQFTYLGKIQSAKWLFGPEVVQHLDELWEKSADLEMHQSMLSDSDRNDPERAKHIKLKTETLKFLMAQYKVLDQKCAPYLKLGH